MSDSEFKLAGISVIMLGVAELGRSVSFYTEKLGLQVRHQSPGFAFLDGGGVTLCLSEPLARASTGNIAGAIEVVFGVDDIHAAHRTLAGRGISFKIEPRVVTGSSWAANFDDPDGHGLSIFGPATQS